MYHHPAEFGAHFHYGSRHIVVSVCHVNLQEQVIKALSNFMGWNLSMKVTILSRLMATGTVVEEI